MIAQETVSLPTDLRIIPFKAPEAIRMALGLYEVDRLGHPLVGSDVGGA